MEIKGQVIYEATYKNDIEVKVKDKLIGHSVVKQTNLTDGTKVNVGFYTPLGADLPQVSTISIPEVNKNIGATVKELKKKNI